MIKLTSKWIGIFFFLIFLTVNSYAQDITIIDAHIHNGFSIEGNKVVLSNFKYFNERKIDAFIYPLPVDRSKTENLFTRIEKEIRHLNDLANAEGNLNIFESSESIRNNTNNNGKTAILGLEYFKGVFGGDPANVDKYSKLGIRLITIYDCEVDRFFENNDLTLFGKNVIDKMNSYKMLIDISHISDNRKLTVISYSNSPVVASHSTTRRITGADFNLSDKVLEALKVNKGYVFVSFNENDLYRGDEREQDGVNQFVDHIDYLKDFLGVDYIGIGSDYQAMGQYVPSSLNKTTTYKDIQEALIFRGYSENDVRKIMCENVLNALD